MNGEREWGMVCLKIEVGNCLACGKDRGAGDVGKEKEMVKGGTEGKAW